MKTFFETSGKLLIENASNLLNVLRHIEKICVKRDFNVFEIPFMRYSPSVPKDDSKQNTEHAHSLDRNLAGFGLERWRFRVSSLSCSTEKNVNSTRFESSELFKGKA